MRGGGTPGRTLLASGRDGPGDGVPAGERSLPALRGDGPATPTLEAMGPSPSVGRASRLLTGFTRAVVRGKHKTKCTSVLPPPLPAASLGKEDAGRLERAKLKIHGVLLTYQPRCARFQQLGVGAEDVATTRTPAADEGGSACTISSCLREPAGQPNDGGQSKKRKRIRAEPSHRAGGHVHDRRSGLPKSQMQNKGLGEPKTLKSMKGRGCQKARRSEKGLGEPKDPTPTCRRPRRPHRRRRPQETDFLVAESPRIPMQVVAQCPWVDSGGKPILLRVVA